MGALLIRDRVRAALLASLLLHVLMAALMPALAIVPGTGPAIETLSFVRTLPIRIETPHPVAPKPPAIAKHRAPVAVIEPHRAAPAGTRFVKRPAGHVDRSANAAPIVAERVQVGVPTVEQPVRATAMPSAAPTPPTVASVETKRDTGGFMPLGVDVPVPVLDPNVTKSLHGLGVHVTLTVVVDADGHTKSIDFAPPLDASIEAQIRSMLASASWDPAICGGGIACQGQATIRL